MYPAKQGVVTRDFFKERRNGKVLVNERLNDGDELDLRAIFLWLGREEHYLAFQEVFRGWMGLECDSFEIKCFSNRVLSIFIYGESRAPFFLVIEHFDDGAIVEYLGRDHSRFVFDLFFYFRLHDIEGWVFLIHILIF